ncbi:MAG: murein biosynthesis integral membrane protein MurJ [Pseudomonadota bacterium]
MSVAKSSLLFSIGTFVSRLSGLLRESVIASVFGATGLLDAFFVAHRIPNMLREMLAEGALGSSFTQRYSAIKAKDPTRAKSLVWNMLGLTALVGALVVLLGITLAPWLVKGMTVHGGTLSSDWERNATALTRVMFPFIAIMSVTSIISGVLAQAGKFFVSGVSPVALNGGYILGALFFSTLSLKYIPESFYDFTGDPRLFGLAIGTVLGALGQFLWQASAAWKDIRPRTKIQLWNEDIKSVVAMMGPMIIGASAGQINVLVNTNFATSLQEGAVSWITLAFRVLQLPIGIFGVAVGTAVLPALSRKLAASHGQINEDVSKELQNAIELVIWLMTPCMVFLITCSYPIIRLLLEGGKFNEMSVHQTSMALAAYSWGVVPYGLIKVFTAYFYASSRTKWPMYVGFISIGFNFLLNWLFVKQLGHVGLAATAALMFSVNTGFLILGLRQDPIQWNKSRLITSLTWVLGAALASALVCLITPVDLVWKSSGGIWARKLEAGIGLTVDGLVVFIFFSLAAMAYLRLSPRSLFEMAKVRLKRGKKHEGSR